MGTDYDGELCVYGDYTVMTKATQAGRCNSQKMRLPVCQLCLFSFSFFYSHLK
jgi:hypothetical protein